MQLNLRDHKNCPLFIGTHIHIRLLWITDMSYTAVVSPLRHKQDISLLKNYNTHTVNDVTVAHEANFVNDAVLTETLCRSRGLPIIPPYDALSDRASRGYFSTDVAQRLVAITLHGGPLYIPTRSPNKLSTRHLVPHSPGLDDLRERENSFVNDAITSEKQRTKYKDTLLVPYEALDDVHCRDFFSKDNVKLLLRKTRPDIKLPIRRSGSLSPSRSPTRMPSPGDKTSRQSRESGKNVAPRPNNISQFLINCPLASVPAGINKLSTRGRCMMTPPVDTLKKREEMFVNDAILTDRSRTKYKDIIPPYTAVGDNHCKHYFIRPDVQRLLSKTSPQESQLLRRAKKSR